jgi:hypothetical protein
MTDSKQLLNNWFCIGRNETVSPSSRQAKLPRAQRISELQPQMNADC